MIQVIPGIGGEVLMHVFAGGDSEYADAGEFLFTLVMTDEFDPWQPIPGDVTGDGSVTQDDIDIILANWGLQGDDLASFDGDLNGDGVVDGDDLLIAMGHLGTRPFDIEWNPGGQPIATASGGGETSTLSRVQPRVVKHRTKQYSLMTRPREQMLKAMTAWKQQLISVAFGTIRIYLVPVYLGFSPPVAQQYEQVKPIHAAVTIEILGAVIGIGTCAPRAEEDE